MVKKKVVGIDEVTGKAVLSDKKVQASNEYHVKYRRDKYRDIHVYIPKNSALEVWIDSKPSASTYIRELIEADMNKGGI